MMQMSAQIAKLATALAKAQAAIDDAAKDSTNPHFKSKYADLAAVRTAIRGPLSENGIAYTQLVSTSEDGVDITTLLIHGESGELIGDTLTMPLAQRTPQAIGSAISYGRRYSLMSIVGIAADDDDGEAAHERSHRDPTILYEKPPRRKSIEQQDRERPAIVIPGVNQPGEGRTHSAEARRQGGLDYLDQELLDCGSALSVQRLHEEYERDVFPKWPKAYKEPANMRFDGRMAEFSSGDDLKQTLRDSVTKTAVGGDIHIKLMNCDTRADYIRACHDWIENSKAKRERATWWQNEKPNRTRFSLSQEEVNDLRDRLTEKNKEGDEAPHGRDVAGNPLSILDGG